MGIKSVMQLVEALLDNAAFGSPQRPISIRPEKIAYRAHHKFLGRLHFYELLDEHRGGRKHGADLHIAWLPGSRHQKSERTVLADECLQAFAKFGCVDHWRLAGANVRSYLILRRADRMRAEIIDSHLKHREAQDLADRFERIDLHNQPEVKDDLLAGFRPSGEKLSDQGIAALELIAGRHFLCNLGE